MDPLCDDSEALKVGVDAGDGKEYGCLKHETSYRVDTKLCER